MSNICIGLKKTCLGILKRKERDIYNETGLKEGGGIEMSIYSAPFAMLALFALKYLPVHCRNRSIKCF